MVDLLVFSIFIAFGIISWRLRISYRVSVVAGLLLLVVAAAATSIGQQDVADFIAAFVYYFLVVGVSLAIWGYVCGERGRRIIRPRPRGPCRHSSVAASQASRKGI